jgi:adenylate cyclase
MTLPKIPRSVLALAALSVLGVYLFATAPADLDATAGGGRDVPVDVMFRMLDAENASVRAIYTAEIVTPGLKNGLKYREDWKQKHVEAGPLPALVLRETANRLQQRVPELSLFLGSSFPIEASNAFTGAQSDYFAKIDQSGEPQFFRDASTGRHTAMFPGIASAEACVTCHNDHPKSPRKDWKLKDTMGATTWSFARDRVSTRELVEILAAYRASAIDTYAAYLKKTESFADAGRPQLGARWPREGRYLPDLDTFRHRVEERNSIATLNLLMQARGDGERAMATAPRAPVPGSDNGKGGSDGQDAGERALATGTAGMSP